MSKEQGRKPNYNPEHIAKLAEGVEVWNAWYEEKREIDDTFKAQFQGASLSLYLHKLKGINLIEANLADVGFYKANLEGANLFMANLEGANFMEANLKGADLGYANLEGARLEATHLESADLRCANLEGASLSCAYLQGADLQSSKLKSVRLGGAHLEGAKLNRANLEGADLQSAYLMEANLEGVNLQGAKLNYANLQDANLQDANLANVNLAYAKNIRFSDNKIKDVVITSTTTAPWLMLKKNYTNIMMLFTLTAVFAFFLPYIVNIATWRSVNLSQNLASDMQPTLSAVSKKLENYKAVTINQTTETILILDVIQILSDKAATTTLCLAEECKSWEIWQLLLGVRRHWSFAVLSFFLISYNFARGYLTRGVSILKDSEQATGLTPCWKSIFLKMPFFSWKIPIWYRSGYQHYYRVHILVRGLEVLAFISFVYHSYHWLRDIVLLPMKS